MATATGHAPRTWGPREERRRPEPAATSRAIHGLPLGRAFGVQIVADWSLFLIFALGFVILTLPLGVFLTSLSRRLAVKR